MTNIEEKFLSFLREADSPDTLPSSHASPRLGSPEKKGEAPLPPKRFWWLKTPATSTEDTLKDTPGVGNDKKLTTVSTQSSVSSSMAEFLEKERLCREGSKTSQGDIDKRSPSPIAESSTSKVDYTDDFTDDDISSIIDQISLIAGSALEDSGSKSVDDILREAEEVVKESARVLRQETAAEIFSPHKTGAIPKHKDYSLPPPLVKPAAHLVVHRKESQEDEEKFKSGFTDRVVSNHRVVTEDANAIFEQIDKEVRSKIAAARMKDQTLSSKSVAESNKYFDLETEKAAKKHATGKEQQSSDARPEISKDFPKKTDLRRPYSPTKYQPLSIVLEESLSDASSLDSDAPSCSKSEPNRELNKTSHAAINKTGHESSHNSSHEETRTSLREESHKSSRPSVSSDCQKLCHEVPRKSSHGESHKSSRDETHKFCTDGIYKELTEERNKSQQLRADMDQKLHESKHQIVALKRKHEEERFALERDLCRLKAKVAEYDKMNAKPLEVGGGDGPWNNASSNHRVKLLEEELQKQEDIILTYQKENVKLCQDVKQLKSDLKARELTEENLASLSARRGTVKGASEKEALTEKLKDKEERIITLNMEIDTLRGDKETVEKSAGKFKLQNTHLMAEVENLKQLLRDSKSNEMAESVSKYEREIETQTEAYLKIEDDYENLRRELKCTSDELELRKRELHEEIANGRRRVETLETKVAVLQTELEKETSHAHKCREEEAEDKAKIQDLTRQVKEMENILKRSHPDSISALIMAANSEVESTGGNSPRVQYLEGRVKQLEEILESTKAELDGTIKDIQDKYKALKEKYDVNVAALNVELAAWKQEAALYKDTVNESSKRAAAASKEAAKKSVQSVKEDSHLIATIRGLQQDLAAKEKAGRILEKKLEDANKTNKRLQAEREKVLMHQTASKGKKAQDDKGKVQRLTELESLVSRLETYTAEKDDQIMKLQSELMIIKERRLRDLEELQQEHEVELSRVFNVGHSSHGNNSHVLELQAEIYKQQSAIEQLRKQLEKLDECRAEILVLKVEREHLEKSLKETNKKLNIFRDAQSPDESRYATLHDKIANLEIRHESREQKLQAVVRELLRINQEKGGEPGELDALRDKLKQKDRETWELKREIDRVSKRLVELEEDTIVYQASD